MFLHIGNGKNIKKKKIIGIFDLDTSSVSDITKKYLSYCEKKNLVSYEDDDLPRSFVLEGDRNYQKVHLSRISSVGLKTRLNSPYDKIEE